MNCGIVLFVYDRPQCTEKVLESLRRNHIKELYVFQDGVGEQTNKIAWEQNTEIINRIDWCKVIFEKNECKASSLDTQIMYGINKVFQEKEEIIVIEDDCVISDDCIEFFYNCFETYRDNKKVISIDAYLEPITIPNKYELPVIAAGAPSSWGWGTWKNRWEVFQQDYEIIKRIGCSMKNYKRFNDFGYPIKKILTEYELLGTWDLWWSINVLVKEGISIRPIHNKIHNIGFENPGTHTSGESPWIVPICDQIYSKFNFPKEIEIEPWAEVEFKKFYQRVSGGRPLRERQAYYRKCLEKWLELKQQGKSIGGLLSNKGIKDIVVFGIGSIGKLLINELNEHNRIEYFVMSNKKTEEFMGYPVYDCEEELPVKTSSLFLVVIPGYDLEEIKRLIGEKFFAVYSLADILG